MVFERGTSHPRCISEPLSDNQNELTAVTTKYTRALENWEEALVYGEINLLFQKWSTFGKVSKWTNYEALLNHFEQFVCHSNTCVLNSKNIYIKIQAWCGHHKIYYFIFWSRKGNMMMQMIIGLSHPLPGANVNLKSKLFFSFFPLKIP